MSAEHLFHASFRKHLPHSPLGRLTNFDAGQTNVTVTDLPVSMFEQKVNGVCKVCNETWMNQIDLDAQEILVDLGTARRAFIRPDEIFRFSLWATKVALLRAHVNKSQSWHADPELAHLLYDTRLPVPGIQIRVGRARELLKEGGSNGSVELKAHDPRVALADPDQLSRVNVLEWCMGALITHVVVSSPDRVATTFAAQIGKSVSRIAGPSMRKVWPGPRRRVQLGEHLSRDTVARIGNLNHLINGAALHTSDYQ